MFLFVATNMAIFCKCSKLFREDDVGALTLSSRAGKGRNGGETLREDDVGALTLSSRAGKGRNGGENVREDDVGVLTLSSRAWNRAGECIGAGPCLDMPFY